MGCDIHPAMEYKKDDKWTAVMFPNRWYGKYDDEPKETARVDISRDYDLFAILGNVRNGSGFAGIDTGDGFVPMTNGPDGPEREVPEDISDEARAALSDEHSPTWVTLAEILAYDWNRETKKRGWVDAVTFADWDWMKDIQAAPDNWSGGILGGSVRHISAREMKRRVDEIRKDRHGRDEAFVKEVKRQMPDTYCLIEWTESYSSAASQLWTKVLPMMLNLGREYGHENVRLVMDFDS